MKKQSNKSLSVIIISRRKLYRAMAIVIMMFFTASTFKVISVLLSRHIQVAGHLEDDEIIELEKENSKFMGILNSIVPTNQEIIYEDKYRNIYANVTGYSPPSFKTYTLPEVLKYGVEVKYKKIMDDPYYLRPLYDPFWKDFYFRGWLYLPDKNIVARHRLFVFPFGGSSIFDFMGSLGFENSQDHGKSSVDNYHVSVNYHQNINFPIYGFNVKETRLFENQLLIIGETLRKGVQIVSIVQDDLLPEKTNTKNLLIHLSTPEGFEIDNIYGSVIRYEYLKQKIKEHTVKSADAGVTELDTLEKLLDENLSLKKKLSYFLPVQDKTITQEKCRPIPPNFPYDAPNISYVQSKAKKIPFDTAYYNGTYMRPIYDPLWLKNYQNRWCFIPKQICLNMHRLFIIPESEKEQASLFGTLGFHENLKPLKENGYSFIIYNFTVNKAAVYDFQVLLTGKPSNTGVQIIELNYNSLSAREEYIVSLVTPDDQEVDYQIISSIK